jgi:hypothetical protein
MILALCAGKQKNLVRILNSKRTEIFADCPLKATRDYTIKVLLVTTDVQVLNGMF